MGRIRRKNPKCFILIISLISIIVSGYFSYVGYKEYQNNVKERKELNLILNELQDRSDSYIKEKNELDEKIKEIDNLEKNIQEKRKNVVNLAQKLEKKIVNKETKYKIAYITFDDGPYYNTYSVLETLKKYHVKATFFTTNVNGTNCYDNSSKNCHEVYSAIAKDNHTIANHTYTHGWNRGLYTNATTFINAVKKQEDLIKELAGVTTNIVRFPGGSSTPGYTKRTLMVKELQKNGYGWVDWTAQDGDGGYLASTTIGWENLTKTINEDIEVILFHDYSKVTLSLLPKTFEYLTSKNYIMLPLFYESVKINK